jgi:AsmA protein
VTATTGFKRLGIATVAAVLVMIAALATLALLTPADKVREAVKAEIRNVTGLDVSLRGDAEVSLFPNGAISFRDVTLGDDGEPALSADRLIATLRFFPLFAGRIEIADVALVRPRIKIEVGPDGRSNWSGLIGTLGRAFGPNSARQDIATSFSEIRVTDGTVVVSDAGRGVSEALDNVELSLAWPSISNSFAATGRFSWRGEPVDATVTLTDFGAALIGDRTGVKVRLNGTPLKVVFEGSISSRPTLKIDGTLAADAPSLRDTLRWAGVKPLTGGGFGRFSLKAKTNVTGGKIALSTVNVELDGNTAEGVLTFATDGRQTLQGTLAANDLNLTPYISTVRFLTSNQRDWDRVPLSLDGLNGFDLDLRLSAARIALSQMKLGRTAVALNLRGGRFSATIGEAQAFGGVLKGSFGLAATEQGAELRSQVNFIDVDLEHCLNELFSFRRIEGRGNLAFNIESTGTSMMALTRGLNGSASVMGRQGALTGINVEQLLRRLERRPLSGASDFRGGRTPYENLNGSLKIAQGQATIEEMRIESPRVRLALAGTSSIPSREFDLRGTASLLSTTSAEAPPSFELPFVIQGPWDDPIILPDTQMLILRSPVASPLFEAVKNRNTRDTVRSAIERLTGGTPSSPPAAVRPAQ